MTAAALSDLRILDLSNHVAGPFRTKLFADFGADVIKVEAPGEGGVSVNTMRRYWRRWRIVAARDRTAHGGSHHGTYTTAYIMFCFLAPKGERVRVRGLNDGRPRLQPSPTRPSTTP
jgi:CoA-transferase family III